MRFVALAVLMLLISPASAISEEQAKELAKPYLDIGESSQQYRVSYEGIRYWVVDVYAGDKRSFSIALRDGGNVESDGSVLQQLFQDGYAAQDVIKAKNFENLRAKVEDLRSKFETSKRFMDEAAQLEKKIDFGDLADSNDNVISIAASLAAKLTAGASFENGLSGASGIDAGLVSSELDTYAKVPAEASELADSVDEFVNRSTDKRLEISKSNSTNAAALLQLLQPPLSKTDAVAFRTDVNRWNASFSSSLPSAKTADAEASIANFNDRRARKEADQAVRDASKDVLPVLDAEVNMRSCGLVSEVNDLRQAWNNVSVLQAQHLYADAKQSASAAKTLALAVKDSYEKQCSAKQPPTPSAQQQPNYLPLAGVLVIVIAGAYYFWRKRKGGGLKAPEEEPEETFSWRRSS